LRAWLIWRFKINYFPRGKTYRECLAVSDSTIMLSKREVRSLFPESEIVTKIRPSSQVTEARTRKKEQVKNLLESNAALKNLLKQAQNVYEQLIA
jgi:hypothetical protein